MNDAFEILDKLRGVDLLLGLYKFNMVGDGSFDFLLKFINEGYFLMVFYEIGGQLQTIVFVYFFFIDVLL